MCLFSSILYRPHLNGSHLDGPHYCFILYVYYHVQNLHFFEDMSYKFVYETFILKSGLAVFYS